ncbi:hypothetical protein Bca101_037086 [Brassica carinata]
MTSVVTAGPTMLQLVRKNQAENPSGPGALSGWILNTASRTSLAVGIVISLLFVSSGILLEIASSTTSIDDALLDVNRLEKYSVITSSISNSS